MSSTIESLGIKGSIVTPASPSYHSLNSRFSATSVLTPAFIVRPDSPADITLALQFARAQSPPLEVAVKGGGTHPSAASSSEGGLVIDLGALNSVQVSEDKTRVTVGGGALWGEVYAELDKHNLVCVGGGIHLVGVGGFTLSGGYSSLTGLYGLAIDNLLEATVVLANGDVVVTSKDVEPDLFWALSGGTNQFGIVTQFVFKTHPAPKSYTAGAIGYSGQDVQGVLAAVQEFLKTQDPATKLIVLFARGHPPDFYPSVLIMPQIHEYSDQGQNSPTAEKTLSLFRTGTPDAPLNPVFDRIVSLQTYEQLSHHADMALKNLPTRQHTGGALFGKFDSAVAGQVFAKWVALTEQETYRTSIVMWELGHPGKIVEAGRGGAAFVARDPHFHVVLSVRHEGASNDTEALDWIADVDSIIREADKKNTGVTLPPLASFSSGRQPSEQIYGASLPRLRKLKAKYDPLKVWSRGWVIEPDFEP